jgi:hypothetical protein
MGRKGRRELSWEGGVSQSTSQICPVCDVDFSDWLTPANCADDSQTLNNIGAFEQVVHVTTITHLVQEF